MTLNQFKEELGLNIDTYDKCECYEKHCIKRRILVIDFFTEKEIPVLICNSIIKLLIENVDYRKNYYDNYHSGYSYSEKCTHLVREFFESVSIDYHNEKYKKKIDFIDNSFFGYHSKDINDITISNLIVKSPKIYKRIFLKDCIDIFIENENIFICKDIKEKISYSLESFVIQINQYKKYNTLVQKITRNLKRFNDGFDKEYASTILINILLDLFETEIKNKG